MAAPPVQREGWSSHQTTPPNLSSVSEVKDDDGCYGNDLMTPPSELLERRLREADAAVRERNSECAVRLWVECCALARMEYGSEHWQLGHCHIQLGRAYLHSLNLPEQALIHATKGRDILHSYDSHMTSHDPQPQAFLSLASAHYIIGRVLTSRGRLSEAEKALHKSHRIVMRYSSALDSDSTIDVELEIFTALGRLCCKQGQPIKAKEWFKKALEKRKGAFGAKESGLLSNMKDLSVAELQEGDVGSAVQTLQEALLVAEENEGSVCAAVGAVLMDLGRAHSSNTDTAVEAKKYFERACTVYSEVFGGQHETVLSCKDEFCRFLLSQEEMRESGISFLKDIIHQKHKYYGEYSLQVAQCYKQLGAVYLSVGGVDLARRALVKAQRIYAMYYGDKHKETASITQSLLVITGCGVDEPSSKQSASGDRPRFKK